jgi:hypothetical protein
MLILAVDTGATLLGIAAVISALGGAFSTMLAIRKSNDENHQQCLENLKEARADAEKYAAELHELKMRDAT